MNKFVKYSVAFVFVLAVILTAKTSFAAVTVPPNLMQGSSGQEVMDLQAALNAAGYTPVLSVDGSFGPMTKAAVMWYQSAHGLTADGVVGPMTSASVNGVVVGPSVPGCPAGAVFNYMTGDPCDDSDDDSNDGDLDGGAGSITVESLSSFSGEDVGEGEEDVEVLALEVEADDGSDVEVTSMKVEFVQGTAADSEDLTDYADSISIWFNGEKVGEDDASDFSESSDVWTKSISLDGAIIDAGDTEEFTVAVTALDNLDSGDIDTDAWTVDVLNVRFEDADGAIITEDTDSDTLEQSFDFDSFASAADVELKAALHDDSPEAMVVNIDDSDDTDDVELMKFTLEAEGSDINVNDIPIKLTTVGADVDDIITSIRLVSGDDEWSESLSSATTTTLTLVFDDLDITIEEGDEMEFTVVADINDTASTLDEGDTAKAELTTSNVDDIDADDQSGEELSSSELTGSALGDEMSFYDIGIMVEFVSTSEEANINDSSVDDTAEFHVTYKVTAFDGTIYVADGAGTATTAAYGSFSTHGANATVYSLELSGTATVPVTAQYSSVVAFDTDDGAEDSANGNVELEDGESAEFDITVTKTNAATSTGGLYRAVLKAIGWNTGDSTTVYSLYDFDMEDYKTDYVSIPN